MKKLGSKERGIRDPSSPTPLYTTYEIKAREAKPDIDSGLRIFPLTGLEVHL